MSSIVGLYVLVEEVQLDSETEPAWIKIRGVFLNEVFNAAEPWKTEREKDFGPRHGWVHFRLPENEKDQANARAEWKELEKEAKRPSQGRQFVALGSAAWISPVFHSGPMVDLHDCRVGYLVKEVKDDAAPTTPYPVNNGLLRIRKDSFPDRILEKWRKSPRPPNE